MPTAGVGRGRESDPGCARVWGVMDDLRSVANGGMVEGVLGVARRVELDLGGSSRGVPLPG